MLDPSRVQFLFVHLEPHLTDASRTEAPTVIRSAASSLVRAARSLGSPALYAVTHGGRETLIPALQSLAEPQDCVSAHAANAFVNPEVGARLKQVGREVLVLCGYAAEVALLHTALAAIELGYQVIVPIEATGSCSDRAERAALDQIARAGGTIMATSSLLAAFAPDFTTEPGKIMLSLIHELQGTINR